MPTLLLRLSGPLQSWGSASLYDTRETDDMPTKSGILGLVGAALGRKRFDPLDDLRQLQVGVRIDSPGRRIRDFQITQMGEKLNANLSDRVYLSDAVFLAGIFSNNRDELEKLEQALKKPVYSLFLGRRSCPPTLPLSLGIRETDLYHSLCDEEWLLPEFAQKKAFKTNKVIKLRIVLEDKTGNHTAVKKDEPISFSPFKREYGYRAVRECPGKEVGSGMDLPETDHDAFEEVGED